jgi:hypothetical protein
MLSNAPCQRREDAAIERVEVPLVEALVRSSGHQASLQSIEVVRPASPATRKAP